MYISSGLRSEIAARAEQEYGMAFWDIVAGFAEDNESLASTAAILGYASSTGLIKILVVHGRRHLFNKNGRSSNASIAARAIRRVAGNLSPAQLAASRKGLAVSHAKIFERNAIKYKGKMATISDHARCGGVIPSTAFRRLHAGYAPEVAFDGTADLRVMGRMLGRKHAWVQETNRGCVNWAERQLMKRGNEQ